jgi:hypothetical protein
MTMAQLLVKLSHLNSAFDQNMFLTAQYITYTFKYTLSVWYTSTLFSVLPEKHLIAYEAWYFGLVEKPFTLFYSFIVDLDARMLANGNNAYLEVIHRRNPY